MIVTYPTGMGAVRRGHARDAAILAMIATYVAGHGYGPTLREIAAACHIPTYTEDYEPPEQEELLDA